MSPASPPSPRIALCQEEDVTAVMKFIHDEWAENHILSRDQRLLRWQYDAALRDGDTHGPPSILLAWQSDRIVGMLGLTYMRWLQDGRSYLGAWASHWFVVPELRKSHLFMLLVRRAEQLGAEFIGAVGVNEAAAGVLCNLGFEPIPAIQRWIAIVDAEATLALLTAGIDAARKDDARQFCQTRTLRPNTLSKHDRDWQAASWRNELAGSWDESWTNALAPAFVGVIRDSTYIEWRYLGHPTFSYQVCLAQQGQTGAIGGLAAWRIETVRGRSERVMRVVELLSVHRAATDCLLNHLFAHASERGVAFIDFYCTKSIDGLSDSGFHVEDLRKDVFALPSRLQPLESGARSLNATIRLPRPVRGTLGDLASRGALYLTKSDGDQDRPN